MLLEIRPQNPNVTEREFVADTTIARMWLDTEGHWMGLTHKGEAVAFTRDTGEYLARQLQLTPTEP